MIDLHCHILPALDDGARDLEDSVAMARQAESDGIALVCATPHIRADHDVSIPEIATRVARLQRELDRLGVRVSVATGGEVAEAAVDALSQEELAAVSLGHSARWILLEPSAGPLGDSLTERVSMLQSRGYRSVIAHPERHFGPDLFSRLGELVTDGALVQATGDYFLDADRAPAMLELAGAGLVHLLASDSHSSRFGRPVCLSGAAECLKQVPLLRPHLAWIMHGAATAILDGADVEPPFAPVLS
jgi:protein-tyrosine phosphatase